MTEERSREGSSCFLQGCLFGAVGLFAVLLLVMLFLAFARFRENTIESDEALDTLGAEMSPVIPRDGLGIDFQSGVTPATGLNPMLAVQTAADLSLPYRS